MIIRVIHLIWTVIMSTNGKRILIITTATAVFIAVVFAVFNIFGFLLPGWIVWMDKDIDCGELKFRLKSKSISLYNNNELKWQSPKEWKIQDCMIEDIDRDGIDELLMLTWKKGRYGKRMPFWEKNNDSDWGQHIYIYKTTPNSIKPMWMASSIGTDVVSWGYVCNKYLVTENTNNESTSWIWKSWGLDKVDTSVRIMAFGDNLIHESIYRRCLAQNDFSTMYEKISPHVKEADVAIINQETPLVKAAKDYSDFPRFGTPSQVGRALIDAGFDVATCATNHAFDKGMTGIDTTAEGFDGITYLGIQKSSEMDYVPYKILERKGIRIAFLNYTYELNGITLPKEYSNAVHMLNGKDSVTNDIVSAKKAADFVIVCVHWGTEDTDKIDEVQKEWAQVFTTNGVDVVIGTHPHVIQEVEESCYKDGKTLIYYSLGNFMSAQQSDAQKTGGIADFIVDLTSEGCVIKHYELKECQTVVEDGMYRVKVQ